MTSVRKKLIDLIKHNPDLPVLAVIDGNVIGNFRQINVIGEIEDVAIDEYLTSEYTTILKSENLTPEGVLYLYYSEEEYDALESPEDVEHAYAQLDWKKAILVRVGKIVADNA